MYEDGRERERRKKRVERVKERFFFNIIQREREF
jgi:hypothetical protein